MPDICRAHCCFVKICPFASNSFQSRPLFTDNKSGFIQMHTCLRSCFHRDFLLYQVQRLFWTTLLMPFWICWAFGLFCFNTDWWESWVNLFTANISSSLLAAVPQHTARKVPLPRCMCTCKQHPAKAVTPNRAFQCSFQETFFNARELG